MLDKGLTYYSETSHTKNFFSNLAENSNVTYWLGESPPWLVVASLFLVCSSQQFLESVYVTEAKLVATEYQVSVNAINLLGTLTVCVPFIMFLPAGYIADRFGAYHNVCIGCFFAFIGVWLRWMATGSLAYHLEFFATFLIAVSDGFFITLFIPVSRGFFDEKNETFVLCCLNFSISCGPLLVAAFSRLQIHAYALLQASLTTISVTIVLLFFRSPPTDKLELPSFFQTYYDFCKNAHFLSLCFPTAILGGMASTCLILMERIVPTHTDTNIVLGFLITFSFVGSIVASVGFGFTKNRNRFKKIYCILGGITSFFFFLALSIENSVFIYICTAVFGFFGPSIIPIEIQCTVSVASDCVDYPVEASVEGFIFVIMNLFATVAITCISVQLRNCPTQIINMGLGIISLASYTLLFFVKIPQILQSTTISETAPLLFFATTIESTTRNTTNIVCKKEAEMVSNSITTSGA